MTRSHVCHDWFIRVTWLNHMRDMTYLYMCHVSFTDCYCYSRSLVIFTCVTWLVYICAMIRSYVWHDLFIRVTWLIHLCDMTYLYMCHDSFTDCCCYSRSLLNFAVAHCNTLQHIATQCNTLQHTATHSRSLLNFVYMTWPIHMFFTTRLSVWHDLFIRVSWPNHTFICELCYVHMCHMNYCNTATTIYD